MLAIIQARMTSSRLPGKVLQPVAGKPLLNWVHTRLSSATELSEVVVATSVSVSDNPIVEFCRRIGISVYRGSLESVAQRLLDCARSQQSSEFVRISGDSPLIDPMLVDQAVVLHKQESPDLTTNVQFRSFPKGQSVEVIRTRALESALSQMRDPRDLEHVTRYFYLNPQEFFIENFFSEVPIGDVQLSVDTVEDLKVVDKILTQLGDDCSWRQAAELRRAFSCD